MTCQWHRETSSRAVPGRLPNYRPWRGQWLQFARASLRLLVLMLLSLSAACATTSRPRLGENTTLRPGWARLKQAGGRAIRDPNVWATLLGAALLQAGDLDREISDQARENTPLFGSTRGALDASDDLRRLGEAAWLSTALLAPGPDSSGEWALAKSGLVGSEWLAIELTGEMATGLKSYTNRERPNGEDDLSCPSYDATGAAIRAQMAGLNIDHLPLEESYRQGLNLGVNGIGALAAWSRVEAGKHYPSDVLIGWAFGRFFGHLASEFIDPDPGPAELMLAPVILDDGGGLQLNLRF